MTQLSAWEQSRPIYARLPSDSQQYQFNPIVDAVTQPWDAILMQLQNKLLNIERDYLDPITARSDTLDWLAQLCGFTGEYWDTSWSDTIKRQLIANGHLKIWNYKGTGWVLQYLLDIFGLSATVVPESPWLVGETAVGAAIGGRNLYYGIALSTGVNGTFYPRDGAQWRFIEKLNRLYMPCWCMSVATNGNFLYYQNWVVGYSEIGDLI